MATGDQDDITTRITALLPPWFPAGAAPVLKAVSQGPACVLSLVYSVITFAKEQTRVATATGGWLDLISFDFFGRSLLRLSGETDSAFSTRIRANLLQPAATRQALIMTLTNLTGTEPTVVEPWRTSDCGAYGYGTFGYNTSGYYGSVEMVAQSFVTANRPANGSVSDIAIYQAIANTIPAGTIAWSSLRG